MQLRSGGNFCEWSFLFSLRLSLLAKLLEFLPLVAGEDRLDLGVRFGADRRGFLRAVFIREAGVAQRSHGLRILIEDGVKLYLLLLGDVELVDHVLQLRAR